MRAESCQPGTSQRKDGETNLQLNWAVCCCEWQWRTNGADGRARS